MSAAITVASLLPRSLLSAQELPQGPLIGVARGERSKLVKAAVDAIGGINRFIQAGNKVCIKPNISFAANVECGATTSPQVVRQLVELCLHAGASRVFIADHTIANETLCIEKSRIKEAIVDPEVVSILSLSKERYYAERSVPSGQELSTIKIAEVLQSIDVLINLPTAKSHSATGVSLGLKNLMGLIWNRNQLHKVDLHNAIAELATIIRPDLTIIDATRVLVSGGPGGPGETITLDTVVAGTDPVAVDSYLVGMTPWYGKAFSGRQVKHIRAAANLSLGEIDVHNMNVKEVTV